MRNKKNKKNKRNKKSNQQLNFNLLDKMVMKNHKLKSILKKIQIQVQ